MKHKVCIPADEESLGREVAEAIHALKPYFPIKPECRLDIICTLGSLNNTFTAQFVPEHSRGSKNTIIFDNKKFEGIVQDNSCDESEVHEAFFNVMGEETGHFLHYISNPIFTDYSHCMNLHHLMFIKECVGRYSGLVYNRQVNPSETFVHYSGFASKDKIPIISAMNYAKMQGYALAEKIFSKYGDCRLKDAAKAKSLRQLANLFKEFDVLKPMRLV